MPARARTASAPALVEVGQPIVHVVAQFLVVSRDILVNRRIRANGSPARRRPKRRAARVSGRVPVARRIPVTLHATGARTGLVRGLLAFEGGRMREAEAGEEQPEYFLQAGLFGEETRAIDTLTTLVDLGYDAMQFHDDDAVPDMNDLSPDQIIKKAEGDLLFIKSLIHQITIDLDQNALQLRFSIGWPAEIMRIRLAKMHLQLIS